MPSTFNARDAAVYERSMGRWSRRLAPALLAFAAPGRRGRALDVGCGTGSLLGVLAEAGFDRIEGVDASDVYAAAAVARFADDGRVAVRQGDAEALPFPDAGFDAALSQLVLQFVTDPEKAIREMARVVRPGGVVAAAVWNSGGGMPHQRMFWDTAALLDPAAGPRRDAAFTRKMTRRRDLSAGFEAAGLVQVTEDAATIWMDFTDFADFWGPLEGGEGTLGKYVTGLDGAAAGRLADALRAAYVSGEADGPRSFACTAGLCRGVVPGGGQAPTP